MKYRVIQWATGGMGRNCLRAVIDHPAMELVGVLVYGRDKVGKDAGEIARRPMVRHDTDLRRLLAARKNVISINGYSHPRHWGGARLAALEAACRQGGSTLLGAGLNPGFAGEQLAVVSTGVCTAIDHIEVVESVDCRPVRHPDYVFRTLGFGADPAAVDLDDPDWGPAAALNGMYEEVLAAMAAQLGMSLQRVETAHRAWPASQDLQVAAGPIARGRLAHFNWCWHGVVEGTRRLTMSIQWYMEPTHLEAPDPPLWRVHVRGQPGVRLSVDLEKRAGDRSPTSPEQIAVAGSVINSIPLVCAAPPGVMTRPIATPFRQDLAQPADA